MNRNFNFLYCFLFIAQIGFAQDLKITEPELILVKGGDFRMGCLVENDPDCYSDEKPSKNTILYDYWMGKYEVTNVQYAAFLSEAGNRVEGGQPWYVMDKYALIEATKNGAFVSKEGFEHYPVNNINWYGAKAYTRWLSKKQRSATDSQQKQNGNMRLEVVRKVKVTSILVATT